jgi:hypothetical protein
MNKLYVKDGDTINIIAELEPTISDPALSYPGVLQAYRIVANSYGPTLTLVPLASDPILLTDLGKK